MSRTIAAMIKQTGGSSEKKLASATLQTMKAIRIHSYGGPEVLQREIYCVRSHKRVKFSSAFTQRE